MRNTLYLIISYILLGFFPAAAQGLINVKHYSVKDGMSQNTVQSILQDEKGYLWMATWNGLEKFDGYTFKNYKSYPTDRVKLQYNRLVNLVLAGNEMLVCQSYDRRIYLFDTRKECFEDVFAYHPDVKLCTAASDIFALSNGTLWVTSDNGDLWRIDCYRYKEKGGLVYFPVASSSRRTVYKVALDAQKREWVLTDKGYFVYGNKSLKGDEVYRYAASAGKSFFIAGTSGRLMEYVDGSGLRPVVLPDEAESICQLFPLADGRLGVVCKRGLVMYDPQKKQVTHFILGKGQEDFQPSCIFQDSKGNIWMQNGREHIVRIDKKGMQAAFLDYPRRRDGELGFSFIHEDEYGHIWAFPTDGFFCYYNPKQNKFQQSYVLTEAARSMYEGINRGFYVDNHKNVWLAQGGGVDRITFPNTNFEYIGASSTEVRGLYIDSHERVWMARKDGIVEVYDKYLDYCGNLDSKGRIVKDRSVVFGANVYAFFEDNRGNFWIGSRGHGLFVGKPAAGGYALKQYRVEQNNPDGINSNAVYSIAQDRFGHIWVGTYGGGLNLATGSPDDLHFMNVANRLKKNYPQGKCMRVRSICPLSNDVTLVGTTDGLISFSSRFSNPEDIRFYLNYCEANRENSLSDNDVMHVMETSAGEVYITTCSGGISRVPLDGLLSDKIDFFHYNKINGLPSDIAFAMVEDNKKRLWITFENIICKFSPAHPDFEVYNHFNVNSNLILSEVPPVVDRSGNMYVGCNEGALRINLNELKKSTYVPNIAFTGLSVQRRGGISVINSLMNDSITLEADERNITVSFAALDFTKPSYLEYAYRIKKLGSDWIYIGKNHSVSLVNLSAGNFDLEVKSSNSDGVWTDNVSVLHIHVEPTFWETGWAWVIYIASFLLALAVVSGIIVYIWGLRKKIGFEKQLTQMKLRFFTDISHELRTPLTLIEGPIEEVIEREKLSEEGKENMQVAKRNTERMLQLINQLLDFRKIQNNKMKLYIEQVDIVALARKIYENFTAMAHLSEIDFSFVAPQEEVKVYTDVDKFEKIVFNLLSNAFKYTPKGKSISLTVALLPDYVQIRVKDEGKGIDIGKLSKLFDRFETFGSERSSVSTGIGLSLVRNLVDIMHGKIEVDTALGQGSTFSVCFPLNAEVYHRDQNVEFILDDGTRNVQSETEGEEEGEAQKDITVLVVEDNEELRRFVVHILQREYRVLEAPNGRAGLEKIMAEMPDIVVSDVMMPEMDGIELLNAVKNNHDICHIPVIILSAKASLEDRIKGLEYGADGYITKPFSAAYLCARIKSVLQQRTRLKDFLLSGNTPAGMEEAEVGKKPECKLEDLSPSLPQITRFDEEFIKNIIQRVEENLNNPDFKIEDLADSMGMGRSMFYRKIKSILGVSPIDFVKDMRVKRSVQLLDSGQYAVSEVAYMCGFSSPQYFSRVFKAAMGCTPSEYKEKNTEK